LARPYLHVVGAEKPFGRNAIAVDRAGGDGTVAWTLPLDRLQAVALVGIVRTAAIALLAAVSGMRSSELMELEVGCCRPPEHYSPGLVRYRLASKVIKGQQLGGVADEWESRRGESHPPPLAEPCLNLSAYTAPIVQPPGLSPKRQ
jgi:hypothetical protein